MAKHVSLAQRTNRLMAHWRSDIFKGFDTLWTSVTEFAHMQDCSRATAWRVLAKLCELGLLNKRVIEMANGTDGHIYFASQRFVDIIRSQRTLWGLKDQLFISNRTNGGEQ